MSVGPRPVAEHLHRRRSNLWKAQRSRPMTPVTSANGCRNYARLLELYSRQLSRGSRAGLPRRSCLKRGRRDPRNSRRYSSIAYCTWKSQRWRLLNGAEKRKEPRIGSRDAKSILSDTLQAQKCTPILLVQNLKQQVSRPDNEPAFCAARDLLAASSPSVRCEILTPILGGGEPAPDKAIKKNP